MSDAPEIHQCALCFKTYKRREHLQRHNASHTADRRHSCHLCSSTFQRADVLKRHLRTCDEKFNGYIGSAARRRACDRCSRQKRACNSSYPCQNCQRKDIPCHYSFGPNTGDAMAYTTFDSTHLSEETLAVNEVPLPSAVAPGIPFNLEDEQFDTLADFVSSPSGFGYLDHSNASWQSLFQIGSDSQSSWELEPFTSGQLEASGHCFHWLDKFTSRTGFVSSFECGTLVQRQQVVSTFILSYPACKPTRQQIVISGHCPKSGVQDEHVSLPTAITHSTHILGTTALVQQLYPSDPLAMKTHEILLLIREVITVKPRNSTVTLEWSSVLEQMCLHFFGPANLQICLELYWAVWHPNVNFVHRSTFDPASSKAVLIASMALIGESQAFLNERITHQR